jgi:hypothetical protein
LADWYVHETTRIDERTDPYHRRQIRCLPRLPRGDRAASSRNGPRRGLLCRVPED